jgi:hypothetical protein
MRERLSRLFPVPLLVLVSIFAGCSGTNTPHVLQSISITPASASGPGSSFTAIGSFSGAPTTVSPLPVSWLLMGPAIDPPPPGYTLVDGSYVASHCVQTTNQSPLNYTVIALAPVDPNAPMSGTIPSQVFEDLVIARTTTTEGGYISATAQFICP